jgi:hypothetical protein
LEGNGQARGKKMAKQLASKQVFDQLLQLYRTVLTMPATVAVEKPTSALGDQNMQTHEVRFTFTFTQFHGSELPGED